MPPGTRSLVVTMTARRLDGAFDDGYFDNLDLELIPVRLAPRQGVIQRAWMSHPGSTKPVSRFRDRKGVQANFLFRVLPVPGSRLQTQWITPDKASPRKTAERARRVTTYITSDRLTSGIYKCVLSIRPPGGRFVAVATARARVG